MNISVVIAFVFHFILSTLANDKFIYHAVQISPLDLEESQLSKKSDTDYTKSLFLDNSLINLSRINQPFSSSSLSDFYTNSAAILSSSLEPQFIAVTLEDPLAHIEASEFPVIFPTKKLLAVERKNNNQYAKIREKSTFKNKSFLRNKRKKEKHNSRKKHVFIPTELISYAPLISSFKFPMYEPDFTAPSQGN